MPKILVVDDSQVFLDLLGYALNDGGFTNLDFAKDGKEALQKAKNTKYNMILTDLHMPKLDGIQLIIKLREIPVYQKIPILMLTTEYKDDMKIKGKKAVANGWIVKPFIPAQLIKAVSICVKRIKRV
jgi:two-component system chemotaxis response regulator CheY